MLPQLPECFVCGRYIVPTIDEESRYTDKEWREMNSICDECNMDEQSPLVRAMKWVKLHSKRVNTKLNLKPVKTKLHSKPVKTKVNSKRVTCVNEYKFTFQVGTRIPSLVGRALRTIARKLSMFRQGVDNTSEGRVKSEEEILYENDPCFITDEVTRANTLKNAVRRVKK